MANDQSSSLGFRPVRNRFGFYQVNYYPVNTGANLFLYQPVAFNNSGQVQIAGAAADNSGILGVIVGFLDASKAALPGGMDTLSSAPYLPSTNNARAAVADDPAQWFIAEEDTGGTLIGSANSSGQSIRFTYIATTGNTTTGIANALIDRSTITTGTAGTFILVGPADNVNQDGTTNDVTLAYAKWIVRIGQHQNGATMLANPLLRPS